MTSINHCFRSIHDCRPDESAKHLPFRLNRRRNETLVYERVERNNWRLLSEEMALITKHELG